jgi:hypothetical protein
VQARHPPGAEFPEIDLSQPSPAIEFVDGAMHNHYRVLYHQNSRVLLLTITTDFSPGYVYDE